MTKTSYYDVVIIGGNNGSKEIFTYHSQTKLSTGQLVRVPFGSKNLNGVIVGSAVKPQFSTKELVSLNQRLPSKLLELLDWLTNYYSCTMSQALQLALPTNLHKKRNQVSAQIPITTISRPKSTHKLTTDQQKALAVIEKTTKPVLLHGVTGSGKTRVYLEIAKKTITSGQDVLILVPEITLVPQMVAEFQSILPNNRVVQWHSGLTESQRHKTWTKLNNKHDALTVIGARSATFSPLDNIGLIVIDECHEASYKQDNTPRYDTIMTATKLAQLHSSKLVLGSATPSVTTYSLAKMKKWPIIEMKTPTVKQTRLIELIDKTDPANFKTNKYFSDKLLGAIKQALSNQHQAMIFHNRRGSARIVQCSNCGWICTCPKCNLPLVLHLDQHKLLCHQCGYSRQAPRQCPECQSTNIKFSGFGTKRLESELNKLFPDAKIMRFDADNKKNESLVANYQKVLDGNVDILVGTQILAKGLDLPRLSVLGVIQADAGLMLPDIFAGERTFQQLYQAIGRIGRDGRKSNAIIQTYQPNNPYIKSAIDQSYSEFLDSESHERRATFAPPSCYIMIVRASYSSRERTAKKLSDWVQLQINQLSNTIVLGPTPAFRERNGTKYTSQIVIKTLNHANLQKIAKAVPQKWYFNIDPVSLL